MQYVITMGQAFRGALERALRELGAVIVRGLYVDGSTRWQVLARFPARTKQHDVTQLLWARWPSAAVTVEAVGEREVRFTFQRTPEGGTMYLADGVGYATRVALERAYPDATLVRVKATRRNRLFG
jgi:hypothetical protein